MSNLVSQLREAKKGDRMHEVLEEVPRVKADLGHVPLVTPTSQIVGTQATLNIIAGERYKMTTKETKDLVRGLYGKTPAEISPEIRRKIIGDEQPITVRPADLLAPEYDSWPRRWSSTPATPRTCSPTRCSPRWPWSSSRSGR